MNEPIVVRRFSTLQRVEIAEMRLRMRLLMRSSVSVLFNESKLLKSGRSMSLISIPPSFSTLQRVEIAERNAQIWVRAKYLRFSTLQRVEIAEIRGSDGVGFG